MILFYYSLNGLAGNDEIVKEDEDYQTFKRSFILMLMNT